MAIENVKAIFVNENYICSLIIRKISNSQDETSSMYFIGGRFEEQVHHK